MGWPKSQYRRSSHWWAIVALNLFLGWTVLGWILFLSASVVGVKPEGATHMRVRSLSMVVLVGLTASNFAEGAEVAPPAIVIPAATFAGTIRANRRKAKRAAKERGRRARVDR